MLIGVGTPSLLPDGVPAQPQAEFARASPLRTTAGESTKQGVEALVRCIMDGAGPTTAIAIGYFARNEGNQEAAEALPFVQRSSSILFDTAAVYLAYDEALLNIERLPVAVSDEGVMTVADGAPELRVAVSWRDQSRFEDHLVERSTTQMA